MSRADRNIELGQKLEHLGDTFIALGMLEQLRKLDKDEKRILRTAQAGLRRLKK